MANSPTPGSPIHGATDSDVAQDAQTELKRRARRRLIGASALALLAVVVLPMVMDHEPRPPVLDVQVRIPSQDGAGMSGGLVSRILPGKVATPLPPVADSKLAAGPVPVAAEPPAAARSEVKSEPKPESKPEPKAEPKPEPKAVAPVKAEAKAPAAKPVAKPPEEKKAADTSRAAEGARAEAALSGAPAAASGGEWVVQLGAYKDAANVKQLTAKLKGMGVPSYTEKFDSPQGPRTRVRAGPFPTKEAAEKAQAKAKAIGVNGPVAQK